MPFDFGWDWRDTLAFVTDPSYASIAKNEAYPHTYTNGDGLTINAGWTAGSPSQSNRDASVDARLAGQCSTYGATATFRVALDSGSAPGAGAYTIDGAWGYTGYTLINYSYNIKDNTTTLVSYGPMTVVSGEWSDANGDINTPGTSSWDLVRTTISQTFATTTCFMNVSAAAYAGLSHFRLTLQGGASQSVVPVLMAQYRARG